jgi:hypothetical protein
VALDYDLASHPPLPENLSMAGADMCRACAQEEGTPADDATPASAETADALDRGATGAAAGASDGQGGPTEGALAGSPAWAAFRASLDRSGYFKVTSASWP